MLISERVKNIKESPIRKISSFLDKAEKDRSIISFGGGDPSLSPPTELTDFLDKELRYKPHKTSSYSTTKGLPELRKKISEDLDKKHKVKASPENIAVTIGSTEAIYLSLQTLLNKNDETILFNPTYVGFSAPVSLAGGKVKLISSSIEQNFEPDIKTIENSVSKKTKALILLTPDNPTGRLLSKKFVKDVSELADKKGFYIISDETYKDIIYEGKHHCPSRYGKNVISVCSFSKEASVPGFRMGYVYGPRRVIEGITKLKQFVSLCSVTPAQIMMTRFYQNKIKERYLKTTIIPTYKKRRDTMIKMLRKHLPEADFTIPQGAFYIFPDMSYYLKKLKMNDEQFADHLFKKKKVVVVPGHYFGSFGLNHIRFTFVAETQKRIIEGVKRISSIL